MPSLPFDFAVRVVVVVESWGQDNQTMTASVILQSYGIYVYMFFSVLFFPSFPHLGISWAVALYLYAVYFRYASPSPLVCCYFFVVLSFFLRGSSSITSKNGPDNNGIIFCPEGLLRVY